jgi:hypothetical protein
MLMLQLDFQSFIVDVVGKWIQVSPMGLYCCGRYFAGGAGGVGSAAISGDGSSARQINEVSPRTVR